MKFFRYSFGLVLSVILLASCATKFPKYTPTNEDLSWEMGTGTFPLSADEAPLIIKLMRGTATEALSVPITLDATGDIFSLSATTVNFGVGEYEKEVTVSYDYSKLVPGSIYKFTLSFPGSTAGPGGWYDLNAECLMELEYEDYKTVSNLQYVYSPSTGVWKYVPGCAFSDFEGTKGKLEKAKGTQEYYKLTVFDGLIYEFKLNGKGGLIISKYPGYNDALTLLSSGRTNSNWSSGGAAYYFQNLWGAYCAIYTDTTTSAKQSGLEIKSGNVIEVSGWFQKNGAYCPISTHTGNVYQDWVVD